MMNIEPNKRYILDSNIWFKVFIDRDEQCVKIFNFCLNHATIVCPLNNLLEIVHILTNIRDPQTRMKVKRADSMFFIDLLVWLVNTSKLELLFPNFELVKKVIKAYSSSQSEVQIYDFIIGYSGINTVDYIVSDDEHFLEIFQNEDLRREICPRVLKSRDISF